MPRRPDSGHIDLAEVFRRVQQEMLGKWGLPTDFEEQRRR